jgi:hypothetical protein
MINFEATGLDVSTVQRPDTTPINQLDEEFGADKRVLEFYDSSVLQCEYLVDEREWVEDE